MDDATGRQNVILQTAVCIPEYSYSTETTKHSRERPSSNNNQP